MKESINAAKTKTPNRRRRKELLFYTIMMAFPVVQVIIFYFIINLNSILLSLKSYSVLSGYSFVGLDNFKKCFSDLFNEFALVSAFKNSLLAFGVQTLIIPWLAMLFSYYIYKNRFGGKVFNIFLFLPSIISPLVITLLYKTMLEDALPSYIFEFFGKEIMPIYSENTMPAVILYYLLMSFGTSVLLYAGAMSGIDTSVMEAAELDGATGFKEFIYVVFPLIYPTFITFITVGFAAIFTNQLNLFSFERGEALPKNYTYGYFLYKETLGQGAETRYPYLSAMGIIFTLIAIPLTFGSRYLLVKLGPSVE